MLAHELKTPLGVIQLTLDSVDLSAQQQKRLQRSLETMSAVIDRCRLSLQLDEGRLQPKFEQVDIVNEVENLVLACKEPDRIGLEVDDPHALKTDRELFVVILQNLLDNALKYSTPDSLVTVSVQACDRDGRAGVTVCVHNAVLRPPVQRAEQLFEKYFRGSNARGLTGSGLGLHLSKQLAQIIHGQLWVELSPNDIRFCLWTPN
jgi:signal transduction histidine kinase